MKSSRNKTAEQTARFGMFVALAMIMSYIETLIPFSFGVPGIKLGLANLVTMVCLFTEGVLPAAAVSLTRIVLVGLTFGALGNSVSSRTASVMESAKGQDSFNSLALRWTFTTVFWEQPTLFRVLRWDSPIAVSLRISRYWVIKLTSL